MAEPTARPKFTYEHFLQLPDDGKRHELIDGDHYVTPSPTAKHQRILGRLHFAIEGFLRKNPLGEVFLSPFDVLFSRFDVVEPDLLYVAKERESVVTAANIQGSPDLVIEILSPSTQERDRGIKRRLYERTEVHEYWIANPDAETVEVYRRTAAGGELPLAMELRRASGDVLSTPLLPGLELPLAEIFPSPGRARAGRDATRSAT